MSVKVFRRIKPRKGGPNYHLVREYRGGFYSLCPAPVGPNMYWDLVEVDERPPLMELCSHCYKIQKDEETPPETRAARRIRKRQAREQAARARLEAWNRGEKIGGRS